MKFAKLILMLSLLLNLTGCWSKIELDELTFIYGLYIDAGEKPGTVEVTISSPLPNRLMSGTQGGSGSGDGKAYSMVTKTAPTLPEAVLLIQKDLSRSLEISHLKIVVIGKQYSEQGIGDMLEWFKRQPEIPLGTYVVAAPGRAKDISKLSPIFEQLPDQVLSNIVKENVMYNTTIGDCLLAESSNMGYAMNYLSFGKKTDSPEEGKTEFWAGVGGVALFEDERLKGILDVKEGRAFSWAAGRLAGHNTTPIYTIHWEEDGVGSASALFLKNTASTSVKMTPDGPLFQLKLKGRASITLFKDSEERNADKLSSLIKVKLQEKVVKEISDSLEKVQQSGADALQLGMLLEWNYPAEWKVLRERWEDYYTKEVRIKVTANFTIADFGSEK